MSDNVTHSAFAARLNEICDDKGVPPKGRNRQAELGKLFHVSQKAARKWLEGEGFPTVPTGVEIATWGGVSYDWLMTGRGPKRPAEFASDPNTNRVLSLMETMPEYLKKTAVKQLEALSTTEREPG